MTTPNLIRPLSLKVFLDNGGDPRVVLGDTLGCVLEYCQEIEAGLTREGVVAHRRHAVECALAGRSPGEWANGDPMDPETDQTRVTYEAWIADLIEDPTLVSQFVAWLDPDERAKYDHKVYQVMCPHPLRVEWLPNWHCGGCGTRLDEVALRVGWQDGYSGEPDDACGWCFACVTVAYEAMKAARSE